MSSLGVRRMVVAAFSALAWAVATRTATAGAFERPLPRLPKHAEDFTAIPEFQGTGQAQIPLAPKAIQPRALDKADFKVLAPKPLLPFAELSAAQPIVPSKALMGFFFPAIVDPLNNRVALSKWMDTPFPPTLLVGVHSGPGKHYVIDVSIDPKGKAATPFSIQGIGGPAKTANLVGGHLVWKLHTTSDGWHPFYITFTDHSADWIVLECEIRTY